MAKYIVMPNSQDKPVIIKCDTCKTMFVTEENNQGWSEPCPCCPCCHSRIFINWHRIPLWKYNLIKWIRGGFNK